MRIAFGVRLQQCEGAFGRAGQSGQWLIGRCGQLGGRGQWCQRLELCRFDALAKLGEDLWHVFGCKGQGVGFDQAGLPQRFDREARVDQGLHLGLFFGRGNVFAKHRVGA